MSESPSSLPRLFAELKRRKVFRVMAVYGATAFVLLQVADLLAQGMGLSDQVLRVTTFLVLVGFPIAVVLAWAFESTPDGVRRTGDATPEEISAIIAQPPSRRWPAGLLALAGVALLVGGWWMGRSGSVDRSTESMQLDANVVAVLPFRASVPEELAYLGSGFMDLLSARLDGQVGPRAIDPGAVASTITSDSVDARAVASTLGAGRVVSGSVVGGPTRIVVNADYVRVDDGTLVAAASAQGPPDSLAALADRVIGELLSLDAGERPTAIAQLTSTSPEALKAYLQGKRAWRFGEYYEAIEHYEDALAIDSTFALAAIARADASTNTLTIGSEGRLELAWRHRDRLGPRDLAYLEARIGREPRTDRERIEAFEQLTRSMPQRIDVWYWLGEHRFHTSGVLQDSAWADGVRAAFGKTLEFYPDYQPSLAHLLYLEMRHGTARQVRELADRMRSDSPSMQGLADHGTLTLDPTRMNSRDCDANCLIISTWWPIHAPEYLPDNWVSWVEAVLDENRRRAGTDVSLGGVLGREYNLHMNMGRPDRALAVREEAIRAGVRERYDLSTVLNAIWWNVAEDDAEEAVRRIDQRLASSTDPLDASTGLELLAAEIWRHTRRLDYTNPRAAERLRSSIPAAPHPQALALEGMALYLEAWAQIRGGDETAARESLVRLEQILEEEPGTIGGTSTVRTLALMFEELGDAPGALRALDRLNILQTSQASLIWRERGRLAALVGDTTQALTEYGRFLTIRSDSEPELMAEYEAVQAEMERLWGERRPEETGEGPARRPTIPSADGPDGQKR